MWKLIKSVVDSASGKKEEDEEVEVIDGNQELEKVELIIVDQDFHLQSVKKQANNIRILKKRGIARNEYLEEIQKLLFHKFYFCKFTPDKSSIKSELLVPTEGKKIKFRFKITDPKKKEKTQLQIYFPDCIYLDSGRVINHLDFYLESKLKALSNVNSTGKYFKVELVKEIVETEEESQKEMERNAEEPNQKELNRNVRRRFITLTNNQNILMPLRTPGPQLCDIGKFELKITWKVPEIDKRPWISESLIDCGVNFCENEFKSNLSSAIESSFESGVSQLILLSNNFRTSSFNVRLASYRPGSLFASIGIHPCEVSRSFSPESSPSDCETAVSLFIAQLRSLWDGFHTFSPSSFNLPSIVAIGEIGIDLSSHSSAAASLPLQILYFEAQIQLALELDIPVIIHERDAFAETIAVLKKFSSVRGYANCFNGKQEQLQAYLDLGLSICITGLISNDGRNADLLEVIGKIPMDKLLLGSDAPYLTPFNMPKPYPKSNTPATLPYVAIRIGELLNISASVVAAETTNNARQLLRLPVPAYSEKNEEINKCNINARLPYISDKAVNFFVAIAKESSPPGENKENDEPLKEKVAPPKSKGEAKTKKTKKKKSKKTK